MRFVEQRCRIVFALLRAPSSSASMIASTFSSSPSGAPSAPDFVGLARAGRDDRPSSMTSSCSASLGSACPCRCRFPRRSRSSFVLRSSSLPLLADRVALLDELRLGQHRRLGARCCRRCCRSRRRRSAIATTPASSAIESLAQLVSSKWWTGRGRNLRGSPGGRLRPAGSACRCRGRRRSTSSPGPSPCRCAPSRAAGW